MSEDLEWAIRDAWQRVAPRATWRGATTGVHALDLVALGELVHQVTPALVVVAGGIERGGLAHFLAGCLDDNKRGKLVAGESMSVERFRLLPEHRRIQWVSRDLMVEGFNTARRLTNGAAPVLVVAKPSRFLEVRDLASLVTVGSYLVVTGRVATEAAYFPDPGFLPDPSRDPVGLSACTWLLRTPT